MHAVWKERVQVLGAIAAGGAIGAEARHGLSLLAGDEARFPWTTLVENVTGCLLIGVVMAVLLELTAAHRLLRPFVGVGVLGGYTTFSAYALEAHGLFLDERPVAAFAYLALTPVAALLAVWLAMRTTRAALLYRRRGRGG